MNRYVLNFSKEGYIKYTSHLDMMRLFKRAMNKCAVPLVYSCGFNPHPKMGFAQPLSLGYTSDAELLEFETKDAIDTGSLTEKLQECMPFGIEIHQCVVFDSSAKSLAAEAIAAEYTIIVPGTVADLEDKITEYLQQKEIIATKRMKKTKQPGEVDIRGKIQDLNVLKTEKDSFTLRALLDSGSTSNLSPELLIQTLIPFLHLDCPRYSIEVCRNKILFGKNLQF